MAIRFLASSDKTQSVCSRCMLRCVRQHCSLSSWHCQAKRLLSLSSSSTRRIATFTRRNESLPVSAQGGHSTYIFRASLCYSFECLSQKGGATAAVSEQPRSLLTLPHHCVTNTPSSLLHVFIACTHAPSLSPSDASVVAAKLKAEEALRVTTLGEEDARGELTTAQCEISRLLAICDKCEEEAAFARAAAIRTDSAGCVYTCLYVMYICMYVCMYL